jgi:hypothetical protein
LSATAVAAPRAPAADTQTHLPFTSYTGMLVDEAHGHIFFTSGTSTLTITDLTGANPVTVSGLAGAVGLAMSPDGQTVYVAARSANEIAAVDTSTLTIATTFSGLSCPRYLAFAGGTLYFSYGCNAEQGNIGSIDFSGASPLVSTGLVTDNWYGPPYLAAGNADSHVLAAADADTEPNKIVTYDVSSGAPTKLAQSQTGICENFQAMAVTSTGAAVALACGSPYHVTVLNTTDLTTMDTYGDSSPYPAGVAISDDDAAIAAGFSQNDPNVAVYPLESPTSPTTQYDLQAGGSGFLASNGMQFGPSGDLYVVVPTSVYGDDFDLFVLHDSMLPASDITVSVPATASVGQSVTVRGTVASSISLDYPVTLTVTRTDGTGTQALPPVTTDQTGRFSFQDTPIDDGPVAYTVVYGGDTAHRGGQADATVSVARLASTVSLTTDHHRYRYRSKVHLTAHLGVASNNRVVSIYAKPHGKTRRLVTSGEVDAHRNLRLAVTVTRNTQFIATFSGDRTYAPATDTRTVKSHARILEGLQGGRGHSGGYRIYNSGRSPALDTLLQPLQPGVCVYVNSQRFYDGRWHRIATTCVHTNSQGASAGLLYGRHAVGELYRMRAEFRGNSVAMARRGRWLRFRFHA